MHKAAAELQARQREVQKKKDKREMKQRRWSNMQVFLKKGQDKLRSMLKTMTRAEAMQAMVPVAGKSKKKKRSALTKMEE